MLAPRRLSRARWPRVLPAIALAAAGSSCDVAPREARETIERFVKAVQADDVAELRCRLAGAADPAGSPEFEAWVASRLDAYEAGRDRGWVDLGDDGVALTKAFALGKGTYWELESTRSGGPGTREAVMAIRFAYGHIDISGLIPGTVFYVCGVPVGRVHAVRIPAAGERHDLEVLDTIRVRWTLTAAGAAGDCPGGWAVASAVPVPGSETTARVSWVF